MPSQIALFHGTQNLVLQLLMFSVFTGPIWNAMYFLHLVGWLKVCENTQWQGPSAFYCFSVDNTELVSAAFATFDRSLNPIASKGQTSYIGWVSRALSLETQLTPIRMEVIRRSLADRGFSGEASRIISASWPSGTDQQYNSALKKWCCWCEQRKELIFFKHMLMR